MTTEIIRTKSDYKAALAEIDCMGDPAPWHPEFERTRMDENFTAAAAILHASGVTLERAMAALINNKQRKEEQHHANIG